MDTKSMEPEGHKIAFWLTQSIIAINGALIAYAMKQLENSILSLSLIPVGLAIICWALSFYYGINLLRKIATANNLRTRHDIEMSEPIPSKIHIDELKLKVKSLFREANNYTNIMYVLLYSGGALYIIWQLIEMIIRTVR